MSPKQNARVRQLSVLDEDFSLPKGRSRANDDEEKKWMEDLIRDQRHDMMEFAKRRVHRAIGGEGKAARKDRSQVEDVNFSLLKVGKILGQGAFGTVRVVESFHGSMVSTTLRSQKKPLHEEYHADYVVKTLRPELLEIKNSREITKIAADLVKEGRILEDLKGHQNILRLIGRSANGLNGYFDIDDKNDYRLLRPEGFVLVLDRLSSSLKERLKEWKERAKQLRNEWVVDLLVHHHTDQVEIATTRSDFWNERLDVSRQLAEGIEYLHSKRIVHRDLKPENVGFDYRNPNVVKIFDFNIARKLPSRANNSENDIFHLTQVVGSRRYMAPEVGLKKPYNHKADIYSLGLLAYQVLALPSAKRIFPNICTAEQHELRVYCMGERPKLPEDWNADLCKLIQRSWSVSIKERPSAASIKKFFARELWAHSNPCNSDSQTIDLPRNNYSIGGDTSIRGQHSTRSTRHFKFTRHWPFYKYQPTKRGILALVSSGGWSSGALDHRDQEVTRYRLLPDNRVSRQ